ncbi:DUF2142 domain-containing protein [Cryobacterium sp. PH31-L1]|uniref:DUF2142 domain-containing protein n=1 Tax=Cryobacterium sp. PH31-L1 TaxID=3046199 RepID=UPI0024BACA09|nr:DUF2142 domain-containing protein [Cryobacterium sp. PH31-L1]MDJ0377160.1 DUF2142 domain-containing protein [Cryobacterium sp. PH31-L1]
MSWALASPVGSSPDDDFHLASIWCAGGDVAGECQTVADASVREVPRGLSTVTCYAFAPAQSAACQDLKSGQGLIATDRGNFTGLYPPIFYSTMHVFATTNIEASALTMRLVNIVLLVGLVTALCALLPTKRRLSLVWGLACTVVPLGAFMITSNNPSSWAMISAATLWVALVGYFESSGWKKILLGGIALISTIMGGGARADSAAYAMVAVIVACVLTITWSRRWWLSVVLPIGVFALSAALYLSAGQSSSAMSGMGGGAHLAAPANWQSLLLTNLLEVPSLWVGSFGLWALGWLDTSLPAIVWVGSFGVFAALVFAGLNMPSIRKSLAAGVILGAMWVVPTYVLQQSQAKVGAEVQPRYILPLIIMLAGVALFSVGRARLRLSMTQVLALISILSVANGVALHFNMRRYISGSEIVSWNLNLYREWWWIPMTPMVVWLVGTVTFLLFLLAAAWLYLRPLVSPAESMPRDFQRSNHREPAAGPAGVFPERPAPDALTSKNLVKADEANDADGSPGGKF